MVWLLRNLTKEFNIKHQVEVPVAGTYNYKQINKGFQGKTNGIYDLFLSDSYILNK
jgi:ribosomal protein L21E